MKYWIALILVASFFFDGGLVDASGQPEPTTQPARKKPTRRMSRPVDDVIDFELVEELSGGRSSARDTVDVMLSKMKRATGLLRDQFDAGEETQLLQKNIVSGIEGMIDTAEKSALSGKPSGKKRKSSVRPPKAGQKPEKQEKKPASGGTGKKGGGAQEKSGKSVEKEGKEADKADLARRWGFLPEQDREALLQGFDENFMPKYRDEIMRYYRNLSVEAQAE